MMITLYRVGEDERIRYVTIHNRQTTLFSRYAFTVCEGVVHGSGSERLHTFDTQAELDAALRRTIKRRTRQGYRVLYSYFRKHEYNDIRPALFA